MVEQLAKAQDFKMVAQLISNFLDMRDLLI